MDINVRLLSLNGGSFVCASGRCAGVVEEALLRCFPRDSVQCGLRVSCYDRCLLLRH